MMQMLEKPEEMTESDREELEPERALKEEQNKAFEEAVLEDQRIMKQEEESPDMQRSK